VDGDRSARKWLLAAGVATGVALIAGPLLATLTRSLLVWTNDAPGLSLGDFGDLFADPRFRDGVVNSLIAGAATTALSLILGFTLAFLVVRTDMPGRRWLGRANVLPFFLSPYVGAIAWTWLLAPHDGLLTTHARDTYHISLAWLEIYSVPGVIFVLTLFHTPIVYMLLIPPLRDMDAAFEDTARVHGATFWYTLRHITLPMMWPALSAAAVIVFIASIGLFDVPAALGAPRGIRFIPTEIYAMVRNTSDTGRAAAFAVLVIVAALALTLSHRRYLAGWPMPSIPGKGYRPRLARLSWPARIAALALEAAYLTASVLLPLMALLLVSISRHWTGRLEWRTATFANFEYILTNHELARAAIANSLLLAVLGATIGAVLAIALGYSQTRGNSLTHDKWRHRAWTEILLAPSYGMPGIVFGLGFLLMAVRTPIYGTLGIILIACIARFLPLASCLVAARLREINPDLEQIARTSGASWDQTIRHIVGPLLRRSLVGAWLLLFAFLIRELGTPVLLYARGNETISVAMMVLSDRNVGFVAVLAIMQMAMLLLVFLIFTLSRANSTLRFS
jgi:iron(III) transport system permease protein